jgi:hypothetical protein
MDSRINFANTAYDRTDKYNGGFLKGSQTQDNLLIITSCIQKQLCKGRKLYVAFIDFKKAFNFVSHNILFYKLLKSGISGRFFNLIRNMYSKIKGVIKVNNRLYDTISDECGTNQGGPLSPNMFRYMLNDLRDFLNTSYGINIDDELLVHLLWADDLVIMSDSPEGLQHQLNALHVFCSHYQMIVNELKTKIMVFGNSKEELHFIFNNKSLEIVKEYKYLGVIFNSVCNIRGNLFKNMWPFIAKKGSRAYFCNFQQVSSIGQLTPNVYLQLFDSYVVPVLGYASEIWCNTVEIPCVERVQLRFLKYLLHVKDSTCTTAVLGESGRYPIYVTHLFKLIKYWCRIVSLNKNSLVRKAYDMLKSYTLMGYNTWSTKVQKALTSLGLKDYWYNEDVDKEFLSSVKSRLYNNYESVWCANIKNFPILRLYRLFKTSFSIESYLLQIRDVKLRRLLSKFRLSSHMFCIEKGRHYKPKIPVQERLCIMCNLNVVEDEVHVLLQCPLYTEQRVRLFTNICLLFPNLLCDNIDTTFINIMSCNNSKIQFSLAKYLDKVFKIRF